jgi:hypothetical protein
MRLCIRDIKLWIRDIKLWIGDIKLWITDIKLWISEYKKYYFLIVSKFCVDANKSPPAARQEAVKEVQEFRERHRFNYQHCDINLKHLMRLSA